MRILFAGPVPPIRGGIAQHGGRLVEALAVDHDVEVWTWRAQYPSLLYPGAQVDPEAAPLAGARADLAWWSPPSWWRAGRRARAADLLVVPWVTPFHAVACRTLFAAAGSTPRVALVHNALPHEPMPLARPLTRWALGRVDGVVAHSRSVAGELAELVRPPRIEVVPHPPNLALEPTPLPPRPPLRLLFLGFVREYKGLDTALEALALATGRGLDARLTVAGEFWDPVERWEERVRRSGLAERVRLLPGYQSDADLQAQLEGHHALVAPYRSATQSGLVPLAFAAGRPVVATRVGGLAEQVGDGGILVPPGDAAALARALDELAGGLDRLAERARASASSWSGVVEALLRAGGVG